MTKFEFIVDGPPVSQQARRRDRLNAWKMTVRQEGKKYWTSDQEITTGLVMLQITYFYDAVKIDVDNIVKRNLSGNFKVENMTSVLAEGFARGNEFLYIVIINDPDQEVLT